MERMYGAMTGAPGWSPPAVRRRFGGCMLAYVQAPSVAEFAEQVRRQYKEKTGLQATIHVTELRPEPGAEG